MESKWKFVLASDVSTEKKTLVLISKEISTISQIVHRFASLQSKVMNLNRNLNISHQILKKKEMGCDIYIIFMALQS